MSGADAESLRPKENGHMADAMLAKICTTFALIYITFCLYFLSVGQGWGFSFELLVKSERTLNKPLAGLFGTPICAALFLVLIWLQTHWVRRSNGSSLWERFPVPFHREIPYSDPVGRSYRVVVFALVFGLGPYVQGYAFRNFLEGKVCSDIEWPASPAGGVKAGASGTTPLANADGAGLGCKKALIVATPLDHFTVGFGPVVGNNFHYNQRSGLTYFPGWQPHLFLALTTAVFVMWMAAVWPWVVAGLAVVGAELIPGFRFCTEKIIGIVEWVGARIRKRRRAANPGHESK